MATNRLATDQRRAQLIRAGMELLGRRAYDEVSIADIAGAAGVSKGLLYHYFSTKSEFVVAILEEASSELFEITAPDPAKDPLEQIDSSLDAFLGFVEDHAAAYAAIFRSRGAGTDSAVQAALERGRRQRIESVIAGLTAWPGADADALQGSAVLRISIQGWIFFVEGAVLAWLEDGGVERDELRAILRNSLLAAIAGAATVDPGLAVGLPGDG